MANFEFKKQPEQPKDARSLIEELIRKMDEESNKKLAQVNAEEKKSNQGA